MKIVFNKMQASCTPTRVQGRSFDNKLISQSKRSQITKEASIIFTVRQYDMTAGGPPAAGRHIDVSYGANIMKASFVNCLRFEGKKDYFRTRQANPSPCTCPRPARNHWPRQACTRIKLTEGISKQIQTNIGQCKQIQAHTSEYE